MTTFYLDHVGGNDANAGTSFALRWKTFTSGATAARTAPGDTIRIMATPDETLVGNATWTDLSKTVTLAGAVTATIDMGESAWTASANVTSTADTALYKEGTKSSKHVIASGFTTGLASYFATGTLDLSGYQQVSFWVYNTAALAASTLSLRLCTDTAGATSVHTIAIPAIASNSRWACVTVDLGTNLNSAIASVALYADLDPGTQTIQLDCIIACKAASSADSLTLSSLIGKVWNLAWVASTTYASNDIRRPTQPNRNGYSYKVTAGGGGTAGSSEPTWPTGIGLTVTDGALTWTCTSLEDTWYGIQSISGTTVKLDNHPACLGNAGRGYAGTTETVATYKREPSNQGVMDPNFTSQTAANAVQEPGTAGSEITYSGGWNRTDMSTQTGETWLDGRNGEGCAVNISAQSFIAISNINAVRYRSGIYSASAVTKCSVSNCHMNNNTTPAVLGSMRRLAATNIVANNNLTAGLTLSDTSGVMRCITVNNTDAGFSQAIQMTAASYDQTYVGVTLRNNAVSGGLISTLIGTNIRITDLVTAGNSASITSAGASLRLTNASIGEATQFTAASDYTHQFITSQKHQQTAGNHLITMDGGTVISATDQRHTASGISWKFRPTSTARGVAYPLAMPVAKVGCTANVSKTVTIWTRRDSTNIHGQLFMRGGQLAGLGADMSVVSDPSINTWTQSSSLTFTPTEDGVVEIEFQVWDGVGTTNNYWIDDITVS